MKKFVCIILSIAMMCFVLDACGGSSTTTTTKAAAATATKAAAAGTTKAAATTAAAKQFSGQKKHLSYGAGTSGSTINSVVLGHTQIINQYCNDVEVAAEASGGGSDNLRLVQDGTFDMSTSGNVAVYQAEQGKGDFVGENFDKVLGWIPNYASYFFCVVPKESNIQTLADLKGKRVSVGVKGSGQEVYTRAVLEGDGIKYEDFTPYYLKADESNDGLKDGSLDAIIYATGNPVPAIMELIAVDEIRIVGIPKDEAEKICKTAPFLSPGKIPGGSYKGMDTDIPTVQSFTIAFISADVPEDMVYEMTKTLWEHKDELATIHSSQKALDPSMIDYGITSVMKLHPGAEKYYKEKGWIK